MSKQPPQWVASTLLGETRGGLSFIEVLHRCGANGDFVREHSRLFEVPVPSTQPLAAMIDKACGLDREWAESFTSFVWATVWLRFAPLDAPIGEES